MAKKYDVFISYSSIDEDIAREVLEHLEEIGLKCWIAFRDISPGSNWASQIPTAIKESSNLLVIFSDSSNKSSEVEREIRIADKNNTNIVPFRIEDVPLSDSMEYYLSNIHWIDAFKESKEKQIKILAKQISDNNYNKDLNVQREKVKQKSLLKEAEETESGGDSNNIIDEQREKVKQKSLVKEAEKTESGGDSNNILDKQREKVKQKSLLKEAEETESEGDSNNILDEVDVNENETLEDKSYLESVFKKNHYISLIPLMMLDVIGIIISIMFLGIILLNLNNININLIFLNVILASISLFSYLSKKEKIELWYDQKENMSNYSIVSYVLIFSLVLFTISYNFQYKLIIFVIFISIILVILLIIQPFSLFDLVNWLEESVTRFSTGLVTGFWSVHTYVFISERSLDFAYDYNNLVSIAFDYWWFILLMGILFRLIKLNAPSGPQYL